MKSLPPSPIGRCWLCLKWMTLVILQWLSWCRWVFSVCIPTITKALSQPLPWGRRICPFRLRDALALGSCQQGPLLPGHYFPGIQVWQLSWSPWMEDVSYVAFTWGIDVFWKMAEFDWRVHNPSNGGFSNPKQWIYLGKPKDRIGGSLLWSRGLQSFCHFISRKVNRASNEETMVKFEKRK